MEHAWHLEEDARDECTECSKRLLGRVARYLSARRRGRQLLAVVIEHENLDSVRMDLVDDARRCVVDLAYELLAPLGYHAALLRELASEFQTLHQSVEPVECCARVVPSNEGDRGFGASRSDVTASASE